MTQSNQSQNGDNYREPILESDLGEESFDNFFNVSKKEEVHQPAKESLIEDVLDNSMPPTETISSDMPLIKESISVESTNEEIEGAIFNSQKNSIEVETFPEIQEEKIEEIPSIKESIITEDNKEKETSNPLEEIKEETTFESEKVVESNTNEELSDYIKGIMQTKEEPILEEVVEEVIEEVKEPLIKESYEEIRDEIWNKVNPVNENRFKDLNIEENDENRSFLNDISVKITLLDDDIEDGIVKEEEAIQQIKEIKAKINFDK